MDDLHVVLARLEKVEKENCRMKRRRAGVRARCRVHRGHGAGSPQPPRSRRRVLSCKMPAEPSAPSWSWNPAHPARNPARFCASWTLRVGTR